MASKIAWGIIGWLLVVLFVYSEGGVGLLKMALTILITLFTIAIVFNSIRWLLLKLGVKDE